MPEHFGNWQIDQGVVTRTDNHPYSFPIRDFGRAGTDDRSDVVDMLVHIAEKTWITRQDLEDLNAAAQYARQHLDVELEANVDWDATVQMQTEIYEEHH